MATVSRSNSSPQVRLPDMDDLLSRLSISPETGHIWLGDRRMLMLHTAAFAALRKELIENLGIERARGLLTRMGYLAGSRDADLARKIRNKRSNFDAFTVGPQLHALEGIVLVEPVELDIDVEKGRYYGEFIWRHSSEDEAHVAEYGVGSQAVCWMQIGYASGYTSAFMGRKILYREIECRAMGHDTCRIIGKPLEEWDDPEEDFRYFSAQPFANRAIISLGTTGNGDIKDNGKGTSDVRKYQKLVGASSGFNAVCHMIDRVAPTNATVLFCGESGVGKEIFARTLHTVSARAPGPFVAVNCAAIPESLIEAELFGVEKGAFTGAVGSRQGRFERADGGTLFLDEISCLSLTAQGKLLRALQEGEIERVGDSKPRRINVRVVAATNENLRLAVEHNTFRGDLFFRLNVFPICIPPLRERREDISLLVEYFLGRFCALHGRHVTGLTERAMDALLTYSWPGNVRELENMIERAVILAMENGPIDLSHLNEIVERTAAMSKTPDIDPPWVADTGAPTASRAPVQRDEDEGAKIDPVIRSFGGRSLESVQVALMRDAIERCHGNLSAAAQALGISRAQLAYRAKQSGLWDMRRRRS